MNNYTDTLITYLQIFGIGFSFGLWGPCVWNYFILSSFFVNLKEAKEMFKYIFSFLVGRFLAYLSLGYITGISASLLKRFLSLKLIDFFEILASMIIIFLGSLLIFMKDQTYLYKKINFKSLNTGNFFFLGLFIGFLPCAPLLALLFEVAIISKNGIEGLIYMLFFGVGIFLSSLIILGILNLTLFSAFKKLLVSEKSRLIFRICCSMLLIFFGVKLIYQKLLFLSQME